MPTMPPKELFREYITGPLRRVMSFRQYLIAKEVLAGRVTAEEAVRAG